LKSVFITPRAVWRFGALYSFTAFPSFFFSLLKEEEDIYYI